MTNATFELANAKQYVESALDQIDAVNQRPLNNRILDVSRLRANLSEALKSLNDVQHSGLPPAESKPGKMSGDRVRIVIPERYLHSSSFRKVMREAFAMNDSDFDGFKSVDDHYGHPNGMEVICRPSQFGRFIVLRNEAGGTNSVKDLQPELFQPVPTARVIDVSRRANDWNAPKKEV